MKSTREVGALGEQLAERFLKKKKMKKVASNFCIRGGEIDLIMLDKKTLVFCEVKTRTPKSASLGAAYEAVDRTKQLRVVRAARAYLSKNADEIDFDDTRFDVVEIYLPEEGKKVYVRHTPDAFGA
ncbi:MAG: YraN family protein [Clostridia bacterium]|nr:YraN family protein [Clostridia bacterium]